MVSSFEYFGMRIRPIMVFTTAPTWPCSNLLSRQPRLRKAAADTLRHLAERDPQVSLWLALWPPPALAAAA